MKTSLNKRWLKAGLASLVVAASGAVSYAQPVFTFNSSADTTPWGNWGQTVAVTSSFIAGDAPAGQALSTGALGFTGTYGPNPATFGGLTVVFPSINALLYNDISFWVKQEGTPDNNNQIGSLQINLSNYGTGLYQTATVQPTYQGPVATNGGWERFVIPMSAFSASQALLGNVNRINLGVYDGAYSTATTMSIAFDNISFDSVPEPSSLALIGFGAVAFGLTTWNRRKLVIK